MNMSELISENTALKVLLARRSIRSYRPDDVPDEYVNALLDAGLYAANGGGHQAVRFIVIEGFDKVNDFAELVRQELCKLDEETHVYQAPHIRLSRKNPDYRCTYGAPLLILAVAPDDYGNSMADTGCAVQNIMNAACALGLGSCYMNHPHWVTAAEPVREEMYRLGMKENESIYAGVCAGYSDAPVPNPAPRKADRVVINK